MTYFKRRRYSRKRARSARRKFKRGYSKKRKTVKTISRRVNRLARQVYGAQELKTTYGGTGGSVVIANSWSTPNVFYNFNNVTQASTVAHINDGSGAAVTGYRVGGSIYMKDALVKLRLQNTNAAGTAFANVTVRVVVLEHTKNNGGGGLASLSTFMEVAADPDSFYQTIEMREKSFRIIKDFKVKLFTPDGNLITKYLMFKVPFRKKVNYFGASGTNNSDNVYYIQLCCDSALFGTANLEYKLNYYDS